MRHQDFLLELQQGIQYLAMMVGGSRKNNGGVSWPPSFTFRAAPTEAVKTLEQSGNPEKKEQLRKNVLLFSTMNAA